MRKSYSKERKRGSFLKTISKHFMTKTDIRKKSGFYMPHVITKGLS